MSVKHNKNGGGNTAALEKEVQEVKAAGESTAALLSLSFDYPEWEDAHSYNTVGEILKYNGRYYEVIAAHTSNGVAYPVETTFAYYRLVELTHTGTIDDPIPYPETAGIVVNVENGKYYSYKGKIYLAKADMPNCVYPPDTPSMWQWEEVNSGEG